jgi:hypothetical protein
LPCRRRRLIRAFEHVLRLRQPNRDASDEIDVSAPRHVGGCVRRSRKDQFAGRRISPRKSASSFA